MELKEFVSQALIQIIQGIELAQDFAEGNKAIVSPGPSTRFVTPRGAEPSHFPRVEHSVEFDVAITTTDTTEGKIKAGLFVAAIEFGSQVKGGVVNQTLSHLKFSVPIHYPAQDRANPYGLEQE